MSEFIKYIQDNYTWLAGLLAGLGVIIQITPIKINPYSTLSNWIGLSFKWVGKKLNQDMMENITSIQSEIKEVKEELDKHIAESDVKEAKRIRGEILDFANSCSNGRKHKMEEYEHIMDIYTDYHDFTERRKIKNGYLDEQYNYILDVFKQCRRDNSFL